MARFAGVHEKGRRSGARKSGSNLVANVAGFPHSGNHDTTFAVEYQIAGARESCIESIGEGGDSFGFGFQNGEAKLYIGLFRHQLGQGDLIIQI